MEEDKLIEFIRDIFSKRVINVEAKHSGVSSELSIEFEGGVKVDCSKISISESSKLTSIYFEGLSTLYLEDLKITYCFCCDKYIYAVYNLSTEQERDKVETQGHIKIKL